MSITDAFDDVIPNRPVSPAAPSPRPVRVVPAGSATARQQASRAARPPLIARVARLVWSDAVDSWIVRQTSPAPITVFRTDYSAHLDNPHRAYVAWCRVWRVPAATLGAALDALKLLLVHPIRGPLTIGVTAALYEIATH